MKSWILAAMVLSGCRNYVVDDPTADSGDLSGPEGTAMWAPIVPLSGFSWVIEGALAGMPLPGYRETLDNDLVFLAGEGVDLLVSLTEDALDPDQVQAHGMDPLHIPIEDFTAPEQDQIDEFVATVAERLDEREQVGVHCLGGLGRTGTMLATWFVVEGRTADEAIDHIRELRPGSIETSEQEDAIRLFEERIRSDTR